MAEFSKERADSYIEEHKAEVNKTYYPSAHFAAEIGWINDPNGFVYYQGAYHLFYQYYPYGTEWGPMHWGHARTQDFVTWEYLPVALAPDMPYDKDGCFSGSALVKDDKLYLLYTGHIVNEDGNVRQVQNVAISEDGIHFEKYQNNPVATGAILPDELVVSDFRDPKLFQKGDRYYAVVAAKHKDDLGCIVLLGSDNLLDWNFESILLKGETHQGIMWECPDYFEMDGASYLVMSPMCYQREGEHFVNLNSSIIFKGEVNWQDKTFSPEWVKEIDHGQDFYAPQTLQEDQGRRIMIAWMHTWGRSVVPHDLEHGWAGNMTLPRQLISKGNSIYQVPLAETLAKLSELSLDTVVNNAGYLELDLTGSKRLTFGDSGDYIAFGYDADKELVYIDRSHQKQAIRGEETWDTSYRAVPIKANKLLVVLDKNSIEVFVNDGQETLTATHYLQGEKYLSDIS